jgi:predicted nucleic acid-binding protein
MAAVSDTTPLNYLILIGEVDVLPHLYEKVFIPRSVAEELQHERTPDPVRRWIANPPPWLRVEAVSLPIEPLLADLEAGERDAILLARHVKADLLLIDERAGREAAGRYGLRVSGTLGVLDRAAELGLLEFERAIEQLRQTTFRMTAALLQPFLERAVRRTQPPSPSPADALSRGEDNGGSSGAI